ncbi:hypothetical protein GS426_07450 [Rhodococcus hoagii]|nr:hypothetical protein [Prescottella equi]
MFGALSAASHATFSPSAREKGAWARGRTSGFGRASGWGAGSGRSGGRPLGQRNGHAERR